MNKSLRNRQAIQQVPKNRCRKSNHIGTDKTSNTNIISNTTALGSPLHYRQVDSYISNSNNESGFKACIKKVTTPLNNLVNIVFNRGEMEM